MMRITITCENDGNDAFVGLSQGEVCAWLLGQAAGHTSDNNGVIANLRDDNGNTVAYVHVATAEHAYAFPVCCPECGSENVWLNGSMEWANKLDGWVHASDDGEYFCRDCEHGWHE